MVTYDEDYSRINSRFDDLWPICRSITGPGFRESLEILQQDIQLEVESIPTGTSVFDWEIPPEWQIDEAKLTGPEGNVYADLDDTNLAVLNYSEPVDKRLKLNELDPHLYTLPEIPDAVPYVTSYYERNWGFCLPHNVYETLPDGEYHAHIDSELVEGELTYGHTVLEGESDQEILLSTYLCHPSLANNELSSPLVLTSLYNRIKNWDRRKYTYRFVIVPETIGSLAYLSEYGDHLQENVAAGLVLTCLGGPKNTLSYQTTRREDTILDELVRHLDAHTDLDFRFREFDPTGGSDERQYCSPGFNLPVGQFARTVYAQYEEYHNSKDTKEFMGVDSLVETAETIERVLKMLEYSGHYVNQNPRGEPMLSKRDLYPTVNEPGVWAEWNDDADAEGPSDDFVDKMLAVLNYSDGAHSMIDISERYGTPITEMVPVVDTLRSEGLLKPGRDVPTGDDERGYDDVN